MHTPRRLISLLALLILLSACAPLGIANTSAGVAPTPTQKATPTFRPTPTSTAISVCPVDIGPDSCRTPYDLRVAYSVQSLIERGFTGKGQTIVDIVSFGSPTLQQDMDTFDRQFGLPPITIKVMAPIGTVPFNPTVKNMLGWAE